MKKFIFNKGVKALGLICCSAMLAVNTSCENFLEEKEVPRLTNDYYNSEQGVEAGIASVYSYMREFVGGETINELTEYGNDLIRGGNDGWNRGANLYNTGMSATTSACWNLWNNSYQAIGVANKVLAAMSKVNMTQAKKELYTAEMNFLRSYFFFDLVQQFGRIPLVTEAVNEPKTDFTRVSVEDVYKQIITDLRYAEEHLRETAGGDDAGRATKYAAAHLLAKVYLTRGSAVKDVRGQKATDMDSAYYYARKVIDSNKYKLVRNFADLWDINNMGNSEVVFSVQFTSDKIYRGCGNLSHLYWCSEYDKFPGMKRDMENGRPYKKHMPTNKTMLELYDRKNDSRFYKSFKWTWYCNNPNKDLALGDTAVYYSMYPKKNRTYKYTYLQWQSGDVDKQPAGWTNRKNYPHLVKYIEPMRGEDMNEPKGIREWVRMRLGETYLIAAEAAGRKGDYELAAELINVIRERAAWHDGETKMAQYWLEEGGEYNNIESTYEEIKVKAADLQNNFVDFILDERGRELLGEYHRWPDLVRCEKLVEYAKKWNPDSAPNVEDYHKLRPIPQNHIDRLNPKGSNEEEQNPGYF